MASLVSKAFAAASNATPTQASPLYGAGNATATHLPVVDVGWGAYFQAIGAVFLILAAIAVAFYLLKRFGPRAGFGAKGRRDLKLESVLSLGPRRNVVVVRFLNKRMVLGVTDSNINLLSETETDHDHTDFATTLEKADPDPSS